MNIRGGSKHRIDRKKQALKRELNRSPECRNYDIIRRIKESITRNKYIDWKWKKIKRKNKKKLF